VDRGVALGLLPLPRHWAGRQNQARPLNGIHGRKTGTFEGFNYSPVNKSSGITWSEETFPKYIRAPMQEMPGTRMAFVGIKNDKDIAELWAYLKQFAPDGAKK
jgi:cytochrome c